MTITSLMLRFLFICCLCTFYMLTFAQNRLIGVIDFQLVEINPQTAALTRIAPLSRQYSASLKIMAYHPVQCQFYAVTDHTTSNAKLIRFDLTGQVTEIGVLTYQGNPLQLTEGIAYNDADGKMYIGASIEGGFDYLSESLLEVNLTNAQCTFVGRIRETEAEQDLDALVFYNGQVIHGDAHPPTPAPSFSYIFRYNLADIQNNTLVTSRYYNPNYIRIIDLANLNGMIYFTADYKLYKFDPLNIMPQVVGTTHTPGTFNGQVDAITAMTVNTFTLGKDTTACEGTTVPLQVDLPGARVLWNTGSTESTLNITTPGTYWASATVNSCLYVSDTINVQFTDTETITFPDTTICGTEPFTVQLNYPDSAVVWSDGVTGLRVV